MSSCGITNLGTCLVEKFFEFIVYILNLPVKPLLNIIGNLLTQPVNVEIFAGVWSIIIYILSLFYGILLLIVGFRFLLSGNSPEQREKAKKSLTNTILMMVLIQTSFFLYKLILEVISSITTVIFNLIRDDFFLITMDSIGNIGLELVLIIPYVLTLIITLIFLVLRYICVGMGVIFFAIGIFFYFIEPLNQYGKLIINYLFVVMALPFFYAIIFLASSKFLELEVFANMKIVVMIGAFSLANLGTLFLIVFVIFKAANAVSKPVGMITKVTGA